MWFRRTFILNRPKHAAYERINLIIDQSLEDKLVLPEGVRPAKLKLPDPAKFPGKSNIDMFNRWLRLNSLGGLEKESMRRALISMFLEGKALAWYDAEVDRINSQPYHWTFKEVITSLYNRFIRDMVIQEANLAFRKMTYNPELGIESYA